MIRLGFILSIVMLLAACKNNTTTTVKEEEEEGTTFDYGTFSAKFATVSLPYQLADTTLMANEDTATIVNKAVLASIPDSINNKFFTKGAKKKYIAMAKIEVPKGETYYILKAVQGRKKAALLLTFDKEKQYGAALPFLIPDGDEATQQTSTIDNNLTISRSVVRKQDNDVNKEGKDVYVYNNDARQFTLIMTDLLDESNVELINPIDTFPHKNKYSGDYIKNKNNIVSIRDGARPNELLVFIHFENEEGDCTGELKGRALWITADKAIYRQGGDPCVLNLSFANSSVTLKEEEGCGSHRDLNCLFEGTYPLKKEPAAKKPAKKTGSKKK